jgi:carbon-monoxide dehydrogenase large subunit
VAEMIGIDEKMVEIVHGDTANTPMGMGTYGSRSLAVGGSAMVRATEKIINKAKKIAAHLLEASADDIELKDGAVHRRGHRQVGGLGRCHAGGLRAAQLPAEDSSRGWRRRRSTIRRTSPIPAGAYACEVEVDPETGKVDVDGSRRPTISATSSTR